MGPNTLSGFRASLPTSFTIHARWMGSLQELCETTGPPMSPFVVICPRKSIFAAAAPPCARHHRASTADAISLVWCFGAVRCRKLLSCIILRSFNAGASRQLSWVKLVLLALRSLGFGGHSSKWAVSSGKWNALDH